MSAADQVRTWLSIEGQHRHETSDYNMELHELTDDELTTLKPVTPEFLAFAPFMLTIIHPKRIAEFKIKIEYLRYLSALQTEAWKRYWVRMDKETEELEHLLRRRNGR